jgi:acetolactate synthase I/II/III large subunit
MIDQNIIKYSDQLADWLVDLGYTHCFSVGGGNIMHLTESISRRMTFVPVINEVAAGIAAEYFNESSTTAKALALVTAGPGVTNIITAIAGAYLESRELLVIGGQVKTADLSKGVLRQRGIQEIDGVAVCKAITVGSHLVDEVISKEEFTRLIRVGSEGRKGPVFLEIPLDIQARQVNRSELGRKEVKCDSLSKITDTELLKIVDLFNRSERPSILLGGGVSRAVASQLIGKLKEISCPIFTTWNGADRIPSDQFNYMGRPNTWGQRSSNVILQQSDLLLAIGTRLGLQQTGFNWKQFVPNGRVVHIDIDPSELEKGHPIVEFPICCDANDFLARLLNSELEDHGNWLAYSRFIRDSIPLNDKSNKTGVDYLPPFDFAAKLSQICNSNDIVIPCSSGGAFTTMMQGFSQKEGQIIITNKGLASMGYGLSGAIGASLAHINRRVILIEGDGGFAQNLQEIGTAKINNLNLKIFIFDDSGYASIRMTQKNYFEGRYMGCDTKTGLGLPDWVKLFTAWDFQVMRLGNDFENSTEFCEKFNSTNPVAFIVPIDPEQTYFPKIMTEGGSMESNPLHWMHPEFSEEEKNKFMKYFL